MAELMNAIEFCFVKDEEESFKDEDLAESTRLLSIDLSATMVIDPDQVTDSL